MRASAAVIAAFATIAWAAATAEAAEVPPLRAEADRAGIHLGSAFQVPGLDDAPYAALVGREVNTLTFENDTKWAIVHPERDRFDFSRADRVAGFARAHGMKMRGHVLAWHVQNPAWLTALHPSRDEAIALLHDHIRTVVGHFRDRFPGLIVQWDVVNEGIDNDGTRRQNPWQRWIGDDYMDLAFRFAREAAGPGVQLFYNDYFDTAMMAGAEALGGAFDDGDPVPMTTPGAAGSLSCDQILKCRMVEELVRGLVQRKVPIDGVGFQGHLAGPTPSDHRGLTAWVGKLGLHWALTELDRPVPTGSGDAVHQSQADQMAAAAQACVDDPACDTIVTWGLADSHTWWSGLSSGALADALPFDADLKPKAAVDALRRVLASAPSAPSAPEPRTCAHSRVVSLRLPRRHGERVVRVRIRVGAGGLHVLRGDRRRVHVDLRRRTAGRVRVAVSVRLRRPNGGRLVHLSRRFEACPG